MNRWKVQYQGTAPGMGVIVRHFDSQEAARLWARQVGVDSRAEIVNCEAEDRLSAAAPDLLAALVDAEFLLRKLSINPKEIGAMLDTLNRSAADARAAIARAKGE